MSDIDITGVGVWSECFSNWDEFCSVLAGTASPQEKTLQPELIPAKERRRAPFFVKMAVEVMDQACRMGGLEPSRVATVFASVYGDMQITDYMCRTLAAAPRTISPTRFHNSVHNASTGYWAIATESQSPANAVSAYLHSATMAFLEGAIQALEEHIPVLVCVQELAAPTVYKPFYDSEQPFSTALLLTPSDYGVSSLASARFGIRNERSDYPELPLIPGVDWSDNPAARLLPLLAALATQDETELQFPISSNQSLSLAMAAGNTLKTANA
jgi:hypothetical protein